MSFKTQKKHKFSFRAAGPYLTAFFLPLLIMLVIFIQRGIWPFGERCFLRTDLYHQYAPFFQELRTKLTSGGSMFYSWNIGGGTNFWAVIAYYLASPTNLLIILCPQKYVIEFVTASIVLKIAACSLTMTVYLNKRHEKTGLEAYISVFFGLFYALSGYMAAYNWNVMWLDCLWLFPLVILGLEQLVKENRGMLYCITLGLTIYTNYYIAILVCMGVACYCFFLLGTEREMLKNFGVKLLKFIGYTILAVMFSSVILIPYIKYFGMTASASGSFNWDWYSYFSVFDQMTRHLMNVEVHTGLDHWPNIYCGVAVFLTLPLYYMNKKVTLREKIGYTSLLLFFYFSFSTRSMDYIWHVLHIPNSLPCRQAFIYIFLILTMGYRGVLGLKDRTFREITACMLFALGCVIMAEKLQFDVDGYEIYVFYASAVFMILYTVIMYTYRKGRFYNDILLVILLAVASIEACINTSVTSVPTVTRSDYTSFDEGTRSIMAEIAEEEDSLFYRVEKNQYRTKNDGSWLSYHSISTFSSVGNANLTDFYKTVGLESSTNAYGSMGKTAFTNMLMGVKYIVSDKELHEEPGLFTLVDTRSNVWVYENAYSLPLGYMMDPEILTSWTDEGKTPIMNQNQLSGLITGKTDMFEDVTSTYVSSTEVTMTAEKSGYYYAYSPKNGTKEISVNHTGFSKTYQNLNRSYVMELGWVEEGEEIKFKNEEDNSTKNLDITLYVLNPERLEEAYQILSDSVLEIDRFTDTKIDAHVTVTEGKTALFTTIPFEEGWTVYVDGKEYPIYDAKDTYIAMNLTEGTHTVTFVYHVPLFTISLILTLLSVAILIAIAVISNYLKRSREKRFEAIENASPLLDDEPLTDTVQILTPSDTFDSVPVDAPAPAQDEPLNVTLDPADDVK